MRGAGCGVRAGSGNALYGELQFSHIYLIYKEILLIKCVHLPVFQVVGQCLGHDKDGSVVPENRARGLIDKQHALAALYCRVGRHTGL